jgi:hypothetical protein
MDIGKIMKQLLKRTLFLTTSLLVLSSCAKEEFATNKGKQSSSTSEAITTSAKLCAQSTLIRPQVDILMLWDNTSSFNFVNSATKSSMSNLISSVSENFDYHVLSAPLVPAAAGGGAKSGGLYEAQLIAKTPTGITGAAYNILRTKENAIASLGFTQGVGSSESGVDRAYNVINENRGNGIFRPGAYTIVVVISNEDDKACSMDAETNPYSQICSSPADYNRYLAPRISRFLNLRGNSSVTGGGPGILNSSMMRFINISPLTSCASGSYKTNYMYKAMAKTMYEAPYTNGWPTSNDHLSPDLVGAPDSYNLCSLDFSHIFDGVNTAIKQTLLKHKYDYWPMASSAASVDPDTVRVIRSDGKLLVNRRFDNSATNGFEVVMDGSGNALNTTINTRYAPTAGEPFSGKLIKLFGVEGNDKLVYPDCLTVTYTEVKSTYGYIYLQYGEPSVPTIEVRINGVVVPQNSTNGWDYMGLQYTNALDSSYKVANLPAGTSSGYFLRLNGTAKKSNSASNTFTIYYISK